MTKIFVLDTSSILASGKRVFTRFEEHEVIIPIAVVKELEKKRNDPELGLTARSALNFLEDIRKEGHNLSDPVVINEEGGTLKIEMNHISQSHLPESIKEDRTTDTRILAVASSLQKETGKRVILVSKDLPMRIFASTTLNLEAEDLRLDYTPMTELNPIHTYPASADFISKIYQEGAVKPSEDVNWINLAPNTKAILKSYENNSSVLVSVDSGGFIVQIDGDSAGNVNAKSAEQRFAIDDLYNPEINISSLGGKAGSGKSLLSIVAGIDQVLDKDTPYEKVIIFRPVNTLVGQDLGFLPGEVSDKMEPFSQAVYDTLSSVYRKEKIAGMKAKGLIEVQPLTYIRGRTLDNTWVIVDEAQNLEKYILLTAMTRIGHGSKIVLNWDVSQRDNLHVGKHDGIWEVVQKLLGNSIFSHVSLTKSERSGVAELVSDVLDEYV